MTQVRRRITAQRLQRAGFERRREIGEVPEEMWTKDGVYIWDWNGQHWLVDALDQAGINVEFRTMEHLSQFLRAIGRWDIKDEDTQEMPLQARPDYKGH